MNKMDIVEEMFFRKLEDGGVVKWCEKRAMYKKSKKNLLISEKHLTSLVKPKMSEKEVKVFNKNLEALKGSIYDMELEEKIFYFKEGQKSGIEMMKELFK